MADLTIKAGDTWPPLRGLAADSDGALALADAASVQVIIKKAGDAAIGGAIDVIDPPDDDGMNWQYVWQDGDTDVIGSYDVELEIVWDSGTTPPEVQTVPSSGFQTIEIIDDLGGTR